MTQAVGIVAWLVILMLHVLSANQGSGAAITLCPDQIQIGGTPWDHGQDGSGMAIGVATKTGVGSRRDTTVP
ncbi:MAG: hypothetical protein ACRDS1_14515, partial [Pseudonocardiaceae bacterium]